MKEESGNITDNISFHKLLSLSKIVDSGSLYDDRCFIMKVNTDTDRDIFKYPIRINAYIIVLCSDGNIDLTCNLEHHTVSSGMLFIYRPGLIIQLNAIEPSELTVVIMKQEFFDSLQLKIRDISKNYLMILETSILRLSARQCHDMEQLLSMAKEAIDADRNNLHYRDMFLSLMTATLYKTLYIMDGNLRNAPAALASPGYKEMHFGRFMHLLSQHYREHYPISQYARMMHLSPKYLSTLVKQTSGKLATQWIDEYVILEAKNMIKYSGMSIQEIAYVLHFPNQSFFGKYFKKHTGLSPKAYREQK